MLQTSFDITVDILQTTVALCGRTPKPRFEQTTNTLFDMPFRYPILHLPDQPFRPLLSVDRLPIEVTRGEHGPAGLQVDKLSDDRYDRPTDDIRPVPTCRQSAMEIFLPTRELNYSRTLYLKERQSIRDFHHFNHRRR